MCDLKRGQKCDQSRDFDGCATRRGTAQPVVLRLGQVLRQHHVHGQDPVGEIAPASRLGGLAAAYAVALHLDAPQAPGEMTSPGPGVRGCAAQRRRDPRGHPSGARKP